MMEGPLLKKRTRVKVNKPMSPEAQSREKIRDSEIIDKQIENEVIQDGDVRTSAIQNISSDDDTGTYMVNTHLEEGEIHIEKNESVLNDDITDVSDNEDEEENHTAPPIKPIPVPAPRRTHTAQIKDDSDVVKDKEEEAKEVNEYEIKVPPKPLPRARPRETEEDEKKTKKSRRKKRKAAEVIASVLRRESKKVPHVAAIFQDGGDGEKGAEKDDGDVGSPWDSPPPPNSLEKVYIQHKYGFSVHNWCDYYNKPEAKVDAERDRCAADVALTFHMIWARLCIFSHGVVAGVACCHALAVAAALAATENRVPDFVQFYHFLSLKVHFAIYVFTTLCIISCFDRLDVGQFSREHFRIVGRSHGTLLVSLGYVLSLALSLAAHRHTAAIEAYSSDHSLWNAQGLQEWTCLVTTRDILLLLCWVFMSCSKPADFLQEKLINMSNKRGLGKTGM